MRQLFSFGPETHGKGRMVFQWNPQGNHLATAGHIRKVYIWDRNGRLYDEIHLPSPESKLPGDEDKPCCAAMAWDSSGDQLALLPTGVGFLLLYSQGTRETQRIDTNMKELCFLSWAKNTSVLVVGTGRGNVLIYNEKQGKKIPIMGKHTRKITCGCWNSEGKLALGSEDRQVTVSKLEGDTIKQLGVKMEPVEMYFSDKKDEDKQHKKENTISINVGRKTIYLYRVNDQNDGGNNPIELAFQERYGAIVAHRWFGDGYIMIGFSTGYVLVISTHNKELSEEVHSAKYLNNSLTSMAYCESLDRAAVCGDNFVKVIDLLGQACKEIRSDALDLDPKLHLDRVDWTQDGQVLTVSSDTGELMAFLASLPIVNDSYDTKVVYLTSLLELSVIDVLSDDRSRVHIETEPAFVALGPNHVAAGMNNQAWFYSIQGVGSEATRVNQRDYLGTVEDVKINDRYAAVLSEGRVQVHVIEADMDPREEEDMIFPEKGHANDISCVSMTQSFLIYGTKRGSIHYFYLEDRAQVNEFRHEDGGIKRLYPNSLGTRVVFVDVRLQVNLFNPVNDQVLAIPKFTGSLEGALWDAADPNVFVLADNRQFYVYVYAPVSIAGPVVNFVGATPRPAGFGPVTMYNGIITCQLKSGLLENVMLTTHTFLQSNQERMIFDTMRRKFSQHLGLLHLKDAWEMALQLRVADVWQELTCAALTYMEVDLAVQCYRHNRNAGMVLSLEKIKSIEDKNLLAGHVVTLLEQDYNAAQDLFLRSTRPITALEMRKDLKHWDHAMKLAKQLQPEALPEISREFGAQLEMRGEHDQALACYERSLQTGSTDQRSVEICKAGIARCTLYLGDLRRGKQLCMERDDAQLYRECAMILEGLNQLQECAELYEKGGLYEKAASMYIQIKSFAQAQPLMAKITTPKLHSLFARAKEAEGRFEEAVHSYEMAKDMDSVVRLQLKHLNNPQKAFALVRKTRSAEGANLVAKFCMNSGDHPVAIEFLLMARLQEKAYDIAQNYDEMDTYVKFLGELGTTEEHKKVAQYYESKGNFAKAGQQYEKCQQFQMALKLYLRCGAAEIDRAINVVGRANNDTLTNQLVDFLMGEVDGKQKDHNYLFRLHMALQQYEQAAHTAVLIARQEQELGNYKLAHTQLFDTFKELESQNKRPPAELTRQLMLLHSYILVKTLVKLNDHVGAARMLGRVAKNISKFPRHVVPILTSTVIECQRAGLKTTAFDYASMLMRPEYRKSISEQYKRKIENVVRKPEKCDEEEPMSECPFCKVKGPETELECNSCKNVIPYCIATGRRMILGDWAQCPSCRFPCRASVFVKIIAADKTCPMCGQTIVLSAIQRIADPLAALRSQAAAIETAEASEATRKQQE